MAVFYTNPKNISTETLNITGSEAFHIYKVMRLTKGDAVKVVDGVGNCYLTEIESGSGKAITCSIISRVRNFGEPLHKVTLAAGLSQTMHVLA